LIEKVGAAFGSLPDGRKQSNARHYEMADAALSAFAVFFSQSPSFLDAQVRMQKQQGKNNASSLFGVHEIPSDNQIRNLLDPVPPETLFPVMAEVGDALYRQGYLERFRSINDTFLIALDGTDFFSSEAISCPACSQTVLKNGKTLCRHIAVTPVLVAPGQDQAISLPPEFVQPQDGHDKQDCELAAAARWLARWGEHYRPWGITYLGDDLYCHQSHCQRVLAQQAHFLLTCKPESHAVLYEWVSDFERTGHLARVVVTRRVGKKYFTDTYQYVNQVPLRNSDDAVLANWCQLVTTNAEQKIVFRSAWATSHRISDDNVASLVAAARARWKIENENNNTLKTKGYHFEHNFGHGKQNLANLFATMILMAFLLHTALHFMDRRYITVRDLLPSRRTFFEHLRALLQYLPFDDWDALLLFMHQRLAPAPPNTS
jgi:hypothetical protein